MSNARITAEQTICTTRSSTSSELKQVQIVVGSLLIQTILHARIKNSQVIMMQTKTRIMIFGTFDIIHKGHEHFFKQARALAKDPFLIVSVARDKNVARIKGQAPKNSEKKRRLALAKHSLINKAVLGAAGDHLPHIIREKPDIIALGYDQTHYTTHLKQNLAKAGLKVSIRRLKPYKPKQYKTSILLRRYQGKPGSY